MISLKQILDGKLFIIPLNQRGYAWQKENLKDLYKDIQNIQKEQNHFTGTIIWTDKKDPTEDISSSPYNKYIIEDGQQRITTLYIFLICLYKALNKYKSKKDAGISLNNLENIIFFVPAQNKKKLLIINEDKRIDSYMEFLFLDKGSDPSQKSPTMRNLKIAYDFFYEELKTLSLKDLLEINGKILNKLYFTKVDLSANKINRYITFDTINSRGLRLSDFDKIKNLSMLISQKHKFVSEEYIANEWFAALSNLEKHDQHSPEKEDQFISELYTVFHNKHRAKNSPYEDFRETYSELIEDSASKKNKLLKELKDFIDLWKIYAENFAIYIKEDFDKSKIQKFGTKSQINLKRIKNLDLQTIPRSVLICSSLKYKTNEIEEIVEITEKFLFRIYATLGRRTDKNSAWLNSLASNILTKNQAFNITRTELTNQTIAQAPIATVINSIFDGKSKYETKESQGWNHIYYFLYEYNFKLYGKGVTPINFESTSIKQVQSIEHILPQTIQPKSEWSKQWPDQLLYEKFLHRLGNLTITANNSALSNNSFEIKNFSKSSYCYTCDESTPSEKFLEKFSTLKKTWDKDSIIKREIELAKFTLNRWSFEEEKISFINPELSVKFSRKKLKSGNLVSWECSISQHTEVA